jgi:pimeloyl-ACP methyl ester carboxylesterase
MTNHQLARDLLDDLYKGGGTAESIRAISTNWFRSPPSPFFDDYVARAASAPLQAMIDAQVSLIATDLRERLQQIVAPTLVVFGAHDTGRTIDHAKTLLYGIRGSRLVTMTDSGHSPMVETAGPFSDALNAFLRDVAFGRVFI